MPKTGHGWKSALFVSEYLEMLSKEQSGIGYNKSEISRCILAFLKNSSEGSTEFKNRNISAVLASPMLEDTCQPIFVPAQPGVVSNYSCRLLLSYL